MSRRKYSDAFWTLTVEPGWSSLEFIHWKHDGMSGCYVSSGDVNDAEKFESYRELRKAMKYDEDVVEFMQYYPNATPVKVTVKTEVSWRD